jgi:hypothetical protein
MLLKVQAVRATEWFVIGSCLEGTGNGWNEREERRAGRRGVKQGKKEHKKIQKKRNRRNKTER